jgi:hypothetical protein
MVGTTLIDYAVNKVQGFFAGLISWNMDDETRNTGENNSKTSFTDQTINKLLGTNIGRIFADVKVSESHRFSSNVTDQTLEDGSSIQEHVIPQQPQVTLQIEETNNTLGSRFSGGFFGPQQTFDKLVQLWENSVPLKITTQHKTYENMVISNMPILHRAPYRNSLQISIDLKKLNFAKLETVSYKGKTAGITKAASSNISGGFQKAKDVAPSAAEKTKSLFIR